MHYVARGFYRELLDEQFAEGFIPDDLPELAGICGCPEDVLREHWPVLDPLFPIAHPGQRMNLILEEQRTEIDRNRAAASRAGKASAAARSAVDAHPPTASKPTVVQRSFNGRSTVPNEAVQPEEKSREEESREESSRAKRGVDKTAKVKDLSKHAEFKFLIEADWALHNPDLPQMPWNSGEGSALSRFIAASPRLTADGLRKLLRHRGSSEGVNFAQRGRVWIEKLTDYARGPLDAYGRPLNRAEAGKGNSRAAVGQWDGEACQ